MRTFVNKLGVFAAVSLTALSAFAEEAAAAVTGGNYTAVATSIGLALAVVGGALAQGKICSSAMEGISRNPNAQDKMFVPMIIGLVLIESLVIYMLVIAFIK